MVSDKSIRKKQLEDRLVAHGIKEYRVNYLPYLDFDETTFATPYEAGCRMFILYAVAYTATEIDNRKAIKDWLKREKLWGYVSPKEIELLNGKVVDEQQLIDFSWQGECAYILGWALKIISDSPSPTEPVSDRQLEQFLNDIPALGEELKDFLSKLNFRSTSEIFDENLFYEITTTYFRDLLFNEKKNTSNVDRNVSYLRHQTLNWLRRFMDIEEWDDVDTST